MQEQFTNYRWIDDVYRNARIVVPRLSGRRIWNLALLVVEYLLRRRKLSGKPAFLKLEPSGICNLMCLGCRGKPTRLNLEPGRMQPDVFEKLLKEVGDTLIQISFYIWGEPFTHPELARLIEVAGEHNVGSCVSTNLHFMNERIARQLVEAKLDKLVVGIDGASKETYESIRIGGDFELVLKNLKLFLEIRNEMNSRRPQVEWQYVRTDSNRAEIDIARRTAKELGVDSFVTIPDWNLRESDLNTIERRSRLCAAKEKRCFWPWFAAAVQWNGDVYPCCHVAFNSTHSLGNIARQGLIGLWNSPVYQSIRQRYSYFSPLRTGEAVCFDCPVVRSEQKPPTRL